MLICQRTQVFNFENALRGARNPLNSWAKSDSKTDAQGNFILGENDLDLARRLCCAGCDHRKFMRQIFISVDISAPLYWWKEFDTYKVGTVANSTSTMHKIHSKPFSMEDFSTERMNDEALCCMKQVLETLETLRLEYIKTKEKSTWESIIQLLPSSYHQMRTVSLNFENALAMFNARKNHKLAEWHTFCNWILSLPNFCSITQIPKQEI